ncbi:hypothetical protein D5085_12425 [Ectothiorhodospiraceae bacterium BW-2]|nr:hypothetical protein D5085_12425 [Ectothiorhodospiraceae bacterium BW-2]
MMSVGHYLALQPQSLTTLFHRYSLQLQQVDSAAIPGSWFGYPEAGLIANRLYFHRHTPLHSLLHEAGHYICMAPERRQQLHTNAGGDELEESAVNFLALLLAAQLPGYGRARLMADMVEWGYSFRLGSPLRWFAVDADDARQWLLHYRLITPQLEPTWLLRQQEPLTGALQP